MEEIHFLSPQRSIHTLLYYIIFQYNIVLQKMDFMRKNKICSIENIILMIIFTTVLNINLKYFSKIE